LNVKNEQNELNNIQVTIKPLLSKQIISLKDKWLLLETKSSPLFFLSWKWIGPWLKQVSSSEKLILVQATQNNQTVGLGIFVEQKIKRYVLLNSTQWFLHRSGVDCNDQIWIENNNFLTADESKELIIKAIWHALLLQNNNVDEFIIAIYHNKPEQLKLPETLKYKTAIANTENGYYLNLESICAFDDYLSSLSKNTKKQIKRSFKLLSQLGENEFSVTEDPEQQTEILKKCKQWHINKWQQTDTPSGFVNPYFTSFHNDLMNEVHITSKTVVASLKIKEELVGCLYCFIDNNSAYFYLSAFKPIEDNRIKLGLSLHTLFIQWLIESRPKINKYDFLAGEARYKKSLSSHQDDHSYIVVQKDILKFKVEKLLMRIKNKLKSFLSQ
jgi:CelD/BcsL family acetyltransferase involved in cellulose biosynthesis